MDGVDRAAGSGSDIPRAMIVSVGGSPAPVVASLNAQRPARVCFFVSGESRASLDAEILPALAYHPAVHDWIMTPSAEDLLQAYRALAEGLPRLAEKWEVPLREFVTDYTGGTKTMSVALALATVQTIGRYSYVGGTERTKAGLGIVVDGKEKMLYQANPWDAMAVSARQRASLLFARGRCEAAAEEYDAAARRVSVGERGLYEALAAVCRGYTEWDRFAHEKAQSALYRSLQALEPFAAGSGRAEWTTLATLVRGHAERLRRMTGEGEGPLHVADLIGNAMRRGDLEARYDDAVARLYSALEMAARVRLQTGYDLRSSNVPPERVPESLREEYAQRYRAVREDGTPILKLPHYAVYRLLFEWKEELARRYFSREKAVKALLDLRNSSILAHGDTPVGEKAYRDLLPLVLEIAGIAEAELPRFPELPV